MTPGLIVRVPRWLGLAVAACFTAASVFAAIVLPYRLWDSLAFGSWSRSIEETGDLWAVTGPLNVSRPLFYVPQGLLWRYASDAEWVGRLLSGAFGAVLVLAVWALARLLSTERSARAFLPPLAVLALLSSSVFAAYAVAGMTDVPVAAASAATALALWSPLAPRAAVPLAAFAALATVLAKPSGLLALVGVLAATVLWRGRRAAPALGGALAGIALAVAYDAWQAARLDVALESLLRAGNDDFWLQRGAAARWDAVAEASWLGDGARLIVLYGLVYGVARVAGARCRGGLAVAGAVALAWSIAGPIAAEGRVGYPFGDSVLGIGGWSLLAAAIVAAPFGAADDPTPRRAYAALLVWLAPIGLVWAWQRPDEARLLAPAWPAMALLSAAALTIASLALSRLRPVAALAPVVAVAIVASANVVSVDGLGREGWRSLLDLGPSEWSDRAEMENFAFGPFFYELSLARENVGRDGTIVSSDGRLQYFFPGRVDNRYARTCGELVGARFFSFLSSGESLELAALASQPTDAIAWSGCEHPRLALVGQQEGIYAAFVVGVPPGRPPTAEDCHVAAAAGQLFDAVFGANLSYREASALATKAVRIGFAGTRIERTGCATFRVVVTGVPDDAGVKRAFRAETKRVGFDVTYEHALRYPEVAADVAPVPP